MEVIATRVKDVYILKPKVFGDYRGWVTESWSKRKMEAVGLFYDFVQDNLSYCAKKGTLRGLHFQKGNSVQAKLVRCSKGAVLDVAVDIRKGSPTYKQWVAVELSEENKCQLMIPRGFAHGYLSLTDDVEFVYKVDNYYDPDADSHILWNDEELNVDWGITNPILSEKDINGKHFKDMEIDFVY